MIRALSILRARRAERTARGQIATFLLLGLVAILIFLLVLANLGQVSANATALSNAADSTALALGSQLATRANVLCKSLGGVENGQQVCAVQQCKWQLASWLTFVIAIVLNIVVNIVAPGLGTFMHALVTGALTAGTTGTISGVSGNGFWQGALDGFATGFTFALGASYVKAGHVIRGSIMMGTAAGGSVLKGWQVNKAIQDQMKLVVRQFNRLPEYERMREGALLQALSQTVNDPNLTRNPDNPTREGGCFWPPDHLQQPHPVAGDPLDVDEDGDTREQVSCFAHWTALRAETLVTLLKGKNPVQEVVEDFMPVLAAFRDDTKQFLRNLDRQEIECGCQPPAGAYEKADGPVVQMWRALAVRADRPVATLLWQPGLSRTQLENWYAQNCNGENCPSPPPKFESMDAVRMRLERFLDYADGLILGPVLQGAALGFTNETQWLHGLSETVDHWIRPLYIADPDNPAVPDINDPAYEGSAYNELSVLVNGAGQELIGINAWPAKTSEVIFPPSATNPLPSCHLAYGEFSPYTNDAADPEAPVCANNEPPHGDGAQPPIYDCLRTVPRVGTQTGVHIPNGDFSAPTQSHPATYPGPVCQIDPVHRSRLRSQITAVQTRVSQLPTSIEQHLATLLGEPLCSEGTPADVHISNIHVALDETPTRLQYSFDYSYTCTGIERSCSDAQSDPACPGVCPSACSCDPAPPLPSCERTSTGAPTESSSCAPCTYICGTNPDGSSAICSGQIGGCSYARTDTFACPSQGSLETQESIDAPDLRVGPPMPLQAFVGVLGQFHTTLNQQAAQFATIDGDPDDELEALTDAVEQYRDRVEDFRASLRQFAEDVEQARHGGAFITRARSGVLPDWDHPVGALIPRLPELKLFTNSDGFLDGEYGWRDSTGEHAVRLELGPFTVATTGQHTRGTFLKIFAKKKCLELENYCDNVPGNSCQNANTTSAAGRTFVRITRSDPVDTNVGWWVWNPSGGTITKSACPSYTEQSVGLSRLRVTDRPTLGGTVCQ